MLGKLVRVFLALTAISPVGISLAFIFAREHQWRYAFIAAVACIGLGLIAQWIVMRAQSRLERLPIDMKKAKSADKDVMAFILAYVLPILMRGQFTFDTEAWLLAAGILLFVLWSTHSIQVNPVLGFLGFHFYEVESAGGISYLLITRDKISSVLAVKHVVQIGEYGLIESKPEATPHEPVRSAQ